MPKMTPFSEQYVIGLELHKKLFSKGLENRTKKKVNNKSHVHLIIINLLSREKKSLMYNYLDYDWEFKPTLLNYLFNERKRSNIGEVEWRYLSLLVDNLLFKNSVVGINLNVNSPLLIKYFESLNRLEPIELEHMANNVKYLSHINDYTSLAMLVDLVFHNKYLEFCDLFYNPLNNIISSGLVLSDSFIKMNLLNNMLFIIKDKELFINCIRDKGYNINEGPQRWRGQINSMSNLLNTLDSDYRNTLYNHYNYHNYKGNIPDILREYPLDKRHFRFENIH